MLLLTCIIKSQVGFITFHISLFYLSVHQGQLRLSSFISMITHVSAAFFFYYFFMILNAEGTFFTLHLFGNTALKHLRR